MRFLCKPLRSRTVQALQLASLTALAGFSFLLVFSSLGVQKEEGPSPPSAVFRGRSLLEGDLGGLDAASVHYVPLSAFEAEMASRRQRMAKARAALPKRKGNYDELMLQKKRGLYWCPVFKASSSNWLTNFVTLAALTETEKLRMMGLHQNRVIEIAHKLYPRISSQDLDAFKADRDGNVTSFIIGRHPFHRLVSAFRDKLERAVTNFISRDYYFNLYGQEIATKYRSEAIQRFGQEFFSAQNNFGTPLPVARGKFRTAELPIFWEFVQFVKETPVSQMDVHWRPASEMCTPCAIHYDYVLRFENIETEEKLLKKALALDDALPTTMWLNRNHPSGMDRDQLTALYFEQLSHDDIMALYRIYENDFRIFGYTFNYRNYSFPLLP